MNLKFLPIIYRDHSEPLSFIPAFYSKNICQELRLGNLSSAEYYFWWWFRGITESRVITQVQYWDIYLRIKPIKNKLWASESLSLCLIHIICNQNWLYEWAVTNELWKLKGRVKNTERDKPIGNSRTLHFNYQSNSYTWKVKYLKCDMPYK